jgi:hypothetical protein
MSIDSPEKTRDVVTLVCCLGQIACGLIALPLLFEMLRLLKPRRDNASSLNGTEEGRKNS